MHAGWLGPAGLNVVEVAAAEKLCPRRAADGRVNVEACCGGAHIRHKCLGKEEESGPGGGGGEGEE